MTNRRALMRVPQGAARFTSLKGVVSLSLALSLTACGGGSYGGGGGNTLPPASAQLSISPSTVMLGQSATLTWSASSGTSCTASGAWSGAESASGTAQVTPSATGSFTYTLSCSGSAYSASSTQSATLTVTAPSAYTTTNLVADTSGALVTDSNLKNGWGVAFGPTSAAWVANNATGTSTLYDGNGKPQPAATPLVMKTPALSTGPFAPTGVIFNGTQDFQVSEAGKSGAALFIFVGEGGGLAGWSPAVDFTNAVVTYTDASGAVYKGLTLANNGTANFLYATDFHNGKVDVFDAKYQKQTASSTSFAFSDPSLPKGYAPFGIAALPTGSNGGTQIYVTYAQQKGPDNQDNTAGAGLGLINVFDTNGNLITHLVATGGALNAPWGLALAPKDFGTFSNALLVGNFGDGKINAFDPGKGTLLGVLTDSKGAPLVLPGLWGIAFGNDHNNQPHNTLFFAAGPNNEADGLFGRIDPGSSPPTLNAPPVVAVTAPTGTVKGTVTLTATAQSSLSIAKVEFFANTSTSLGVATTSPYSVQWDTTKITDGSVTLTAVATDADGNTGTSAPVTVTVANNAPAAATLSQIQAQVFTPICSGCHNGSQPASGSLPGAQNLTAGNTYANIVSVASKEQPTLFRVKPNDADNSYLIQKLEGTASISGARMPLGGPYLDQATIDMIKSWINSGAPNN